MLVGFLFIMIPMNIIFDGNYLFHKTRSIFQSYKYVNSLTKSLETPELQSEFFSKVIIDFCYAVNNINKNPDRVVVVFDDGTWRKEVYSAYKGKGSKDPAEQQGWETFFKLMTKFQNLIKRSGVIVSKIEKFEGDDLCYFWSSLLEGDKIIVSGDKDLLQLLSENTYVYNNSSKQSELFVLKGNNNYEHIMNRIPNKVTFIDKKEFLFKKILVGDAGDNVPNARRNLGPKTANKVYDIAVLSELIREDYTEELYLEKLSLLIRDIMKVNNDKNSKVIKEGLERNVKLMWLNEKVYSEEQMTLAVQQFEDLKDTFNYKGEYSLSTILTK